MALVKPNLGDNVPENMKELIYELGLFIPESLTPEEGEVYKRGIEGRCMTCNAECAETTMIAANRAGVLMLYCGGACYSDMQIMHWLVEQHGDLVQNIQFRGGSIEADGPKHGPGTFEGSE